MDFYQPKVETELLQWQYDMLKQPGLLNKLSKRTQEKINSYIPEKIHNAITVVVKQMIKAVLFGARYTTQKPLQNANLYQRESEVINKKKSTQILLPLKGALQGQEESFWA